MYARYLKAFEANSEMNTASLQSILRGLEYIISIQVWYILYGTLISVDFWSTDW